MRARSRMLRGTALAAVIGLALVACGDDDDNATSNTTAAPAAGGTETTASSGGTETTAGGATETSGGAETTSGASTGGGATPASIKVDPSLKGKKVEIFGAYADEEADHMRETLQPFIDATGIDVQYVAAADFNTEITTRVAGGQIPDISVFPQPGLLLDIAKQTKAVPVDQYLDMATLEKSLIPGFLDATKADDGKVYGLPVRMAVKSALWYPVPGFKDKGYALPKSDKELSALEDKIISDDGIPWCLGMESGAATGWPGTDWIEEYMLRINGPDVYDKWVKNEVKFNSPEVRKAFEKFQALWSKPDNVVGGTQGILSLNFGDSPADLFTDPPGCYLHRQGNFITGFFPDDVQSDLDAHVGVTYFPVVEGGYAGKPVLAGGDLAMLTKDSPAARAVMQFLSTNTYGTEWASAGGWLSPHKDFDPSVYPTEVEKALFKIGAEATVLRFDGSDLMPGVVGTGSFWKGMVDWIGGQRSLDQVLQSIDDSWPQ